MNGPVIIGGCPRPGTTALWNALTKHSNLAPAPGMSGDKELWFFTEFLEGRNPRAAQRRSYPFDVAFASDRPIHYKIMLPISITVAP
jgi:hypothetical protein